MSPYEIEEIVLEELPRWIDSVTETGHPSPGEIYTIRAFCQGTAYVETYTRDSDPEETARRRRAAKDRLILRLKDAR